jgi:hypothetical protein
MTRPHPPRLALGRVVAALVGVVGFALLVIIAAAWEPLMRWGQWLDRLTGRCP